MGHRYMRGKNRNFFITIDGIRTEVRQCSMCGEVKKTDEFYIYQQNTKYGVRQQFLGYCKACGALSQRKLQRIKYRNKQIGYGIYEELLKYQEHKCAICGVDDSFNRLSMDHDHKTGEVRGLLCDGCNRLAVGIYENKGRYRSEWHTNIIKTYLSDPPINHIPTSVKHGWKYEMGVFPSPSEDNEMEEVAIQSPMDMWEEDE